MTQDEKWLSPKEAAAIARVHVETIYRLLASRKLKAHKLGRQWRIKRGDLDRMGETG